MADTIDAVEIPGTWTDVNALTNITAGTELFLQNVGGPNSIIEFATSPTEPPLDFNGVRLGQNDPMPVLPAGESTLWARYIRIDRSDVGARVTKLQVQASGAISQQKEEGVSGNYNVDLALGLIEGQSSAGKVCFNPDLGEAFEDLWPLGGTYAWPTALESWEIVSDSIEDDTAGTGASTVALFCLDDGYNELPPVLVVMDGTTPVSIPGQFYRINQAFVLGGGLQGSAGTNVGNIIVRRVSDQEPRRYIVAGKSISQDVHFTVPLGKTALLSTVTYYYEKNFAGNISGFIRDDTGHKVNAGIFPAYQNQNVIDFKALFPIPERTDLYYMANCDNAGGRVDMSYEYILVDNNGQSIWKK